jgi:hypothetical protein
LAEIRLNKIIKGSSSGKYKLTICNLKHEKMNSMTNQNEEAHELTEEAFIKHPSNRRLSQQEEDEINSMFETGSDAKLIAQFMSN